MARTAQMLCARWQWSKRIAYPTSRGRHRLAARDSKPLTYMMASSPPTCEREPAVSLSQLQFSVLCGLAGLGLLSFLSTAASGVTFVWRQYLRPAKVLSKYGKWAVVTGASGGIGRAYCDYLAEQGLNICLVSRSEAKLEAAAAEIATQHGVKTACHAIDLEQAGEADMDEPLWTKLKAAIGDMDVGVLVNNAGASHDPAHLHKIDPAAIDRIIAVNNAAVVKLTHAVLPGMVSRGRGAVVNISTSFTTAIPAAPFISLYTASKGFIDTFSKALAAEYSHMGIHVQVVAPGPVNTNMLRLARSTTAAVPTAATYVSSAGRHIGYEAAAVPYPMHAYNTFVAKMLPEAMAIRKVKEFAAKRTADLAAHDAAVASTEAQSASAAGPAD
eukprot:jgi/Ulvmu1/11491/UM077_0040.1